MFTLLLHFLQNAVFFLGGGVPLLFVYGWGMSVLYSYYLILNHIKHMDINFTLLVGFGGLEKGRLVF